MRGLGWLALFLVSFGAGLLWSTFQPAPLPPPPSLTTVSPDITAPGAIVEVQAKGETYRLLVFQLGSIVCLRDAVTGFPSCVEVGR